MNVLHNIFNLIILITLLHNECSAKIMRNNALMTRMMSDFQKDNNLSNEPRSEYNEPPKKVVSLMQKVLCRNFPTIPCELIIQDVTLNKLIEKSIQQINNKKLTIDNATPANYRVTLFPVVNSEDLSSFLQVQETGFFDNTKRNDVIFRKSKSKHKQKHISTKRPLMKYWSSEKQSKNVNIQNEVSANDAKFTSAYNGRKKIRKFYPHKIKYKEKSSKNGFGDYSEEKHSMSIETPDVLGGKRRLTYKVEPADPPVWRIDYMKHGEPSLNMFGYETDQLKGKIVKSGPNVMVDENVLERAARKDILHPDVYIKKNMVRKNVVEINSEGMD